MAKSRQQQQQHRRVVAPVDNKKRKEQNVTLKNAIGSTNSSDKTQRTYTPTHTHSLAYTETQTYQNKNWRKNACWVPARTSCRLLSLSLSVTSCLATPSYHTKRRYSLLYALQVTLRLLHSRRTVVAFAHCCSFWLAATGLSLALALYASNTHPRSVSNRLHCDFCVSEWAIVSAEHNTVLRRLHASSALLTINSLRARTTYNWALHQALIC